MKRRAFLVFSLGSISTQLLSAPATSTRFLLVFLRGGYDAANLLIPLNDFYREVRPNIAVPREAALKLDADWGLHPALRENVHVLYQRGEAAFRNSLSKCLDALSRTFGSSEPMCFSAVAMLIGMALTMRRLPGCVRPRSRPRAALAACGFAILSRDPRSASVAP